MLENEILVLIDEAADKISQWSNTIGIMYNHWPDRDVLRRLWIETDDLYERLDKKLTKYHENM
jgi:hypothetical protein